MHSDLLEIDKLNLLQQPKGKITTTHDTQQNWYFYHKHFCDDAKNCKAPCNHPAAPKIATVATSRDKPARLLYATFDDISGRHFLLDTGALVCVFPASGLDTCSHRPSALLEAANGSTIHTYGDKQMTLYKWTEICMEIHSSRCGAATPWSRLLMVDVKGQRLVDPTAYASLPLLVTNHEMHQLTESTMLLMTTTFLLSLPNFQTF